MKNLAAKRKEVINGFSKWNSKKERIVSTLGWIELIGTVYVDEKVEVQELKIKIHTLLQRMRIGSIFAE